MQVEDGWRMSWILRTCVNILFVESLPLENKKSETTGPLKQKQNASDLHHAWCICIKMRNALKHVYHTMQILISWYNTSGVNIASINITYNICVDTRTTVLIPEYTFSARNSSPPLTVYTELLIIGHAHWNIAEFPVTTAPEIGMPYSPHVRVPYPRKPKYMWKQAPFQPLEVDGWKSPKERD